MDQVGFFCYMERNVELIGIVAAVIFVLMMLPLMFEILAMVLGWFFMAVGVVLGMFFEVVGVVLGTFFEVVIAVVVACLGLFEPILVAVGFLAVIIVEWAKGLGQSVQELSPQTKGGLAGASILGLIALLAWLVG
jgi:hypothetical protein